MEGDSLCGTVGTFNLIIIDGDVLKANHAG